LLELYHQSAILINRYPAINGQKEDRVMKNFGILVLLAVLLTVGACSQPLPSTSPLKKVTLQAEDFDGDGQIVTREGAAQGRNVVHLYGGDSIHKDFSIPKEATKLWVSVRYSNDNWSASTETIVVKTSSKLVGLLMSWSTGSGGDGWYSFFESRALGPVKIEGSKDTLAISIVGGDGYGIEIDSATLYFY